MSPQAEQQLTKRERQIMDVLYAAGTASAAEVLRSLPNPPSYSTVRALLRILVEKGDVRYQKKGNRYIYRPTRSHRKAARSALSRVVDTFFAGSLHNTVAGLLECSDQQLSKSEWDELATLIETARQEGSS
jgi:predicted transcriptional regulator